MVLDDRQENGHGIRVQDVDPNSPAAQAGLQSNDLITAVNGQPIRTVDDLGATLRPLQPGAKVTFQIDRQEKTQTVEATLGHRPPADQRRFQEFGRLPNEPVDEPGQSAASAQPPSRFHAAPAPLSDSLPPGTISQPGGMPAPSLGPTSLPRPLLGVRTLPVTEQDRLRLGLPSVAGAHVLGRTPGSPAEKANIPIDAVITALDGMPVNTPNDLTALLARAGAGREVEIAYFYNGNSTRTKLTLGFNGASRDIGRNALGPNPNANPPTGSQSNWPPPVPSRTMIPPQSSNAESGATRPPSRAPDAQRVEALERRVEQLEQKIQALENQRQPGT
jgi:membrane-associated protease RseP (regulator of RpoE activity)